MINSRPLTYQTNNQQGLLPLTPSHFLLGRAGAGIAVEHIDHTPYGVRNRWRHVQARQFWDRWQSEWVTALSPRSKWVKLGIQVKVGDVVLLLKEDVLRYRWPLGRITATYPGPDGQVRAVDVKTPQGEYRRPVVKIVLLT